MATIIQQKQFNFPNILIHSCLNFLGQIASHKNEKLRENKSGNIPFDQKNVDDGKL
jgi:hypothetical protein